MFAFLSDFFEKNRIDCFGCLPLSSCRVTRGYLLERAGIAGGTAVLFAVPYYSPACDDPLRNLSAYAAAQDYHFFFRGLFDELIPLLSERFPGNRFAGFADHSPIAEVDAAARAGLGVIGKNHLLLTEKYAARVFLGELITDAVLPSTEREARFCDGCGACLRACRARGGDCFSGNGGECLSALTQKKGVLTDKERNAVLRAGTVWGCDVCQEVCPYETAAKASGSVYSPIPFFSEHTIPRLTLAALDAMSDAEFEKRAYAWRGRDTIRRNLVSAEKGD